MERDPIAAFWINNTLQVYLFISQQTRATNSTILECKHYNNLLWLLNIESFYGPHYLLNVY